MEFTDLEKIILDRIQREFPLVRDPFFDMAQESSIGRDEFLATARSLKERGIIRNISGIFNAGRLGYVSVLVAFQVDAGDVEHAAGIINSHPGVSHNYLREHRYNIWFTVTAESEENLEKAVRYLSEKVNAADYLLFRNVRMLKIGMILNIKGGTPHQGLEYPQPGAHGKSGVKILSQEEKEAIRLLQIDLPLVVDPFAYLIVTNNGMIPEDSLLEHSRRFKRKGIMRRYSAVLRHVKAGFIANAMTVWKYGQDVDIDHIAQIFFSRPMISHLYLRSVYPGKWEYPLFAIIHARSEGELDGIISDLSLESGLRDYQVLRTLREFKKERVVYNSQLFNDWERQAGI